MTKLGFCDNIHFDFLDYLCFLERAHSEPYLTNTMLEYKENLDAVKSVKHLVIHGTGVRFGDSSTKDSDGEFFNSETVTGLKNGSDRPFLMEHGWSPKFGKAIVADAVYEKSSDGWTYEATFFDTPKGNEAFSEIISKPYRSSAGAAGHTRSASLVDGAFKLDTWLIAEQSATLTPADYENPRITRTKNDFLMFYLKQMQDEQTAKIQEHLDFLVKDANGQREKLAAALTSLKESLSSGEKFVVTEDFLTSLEQVTQPIPIINL